ncbi:hypothetical protein F5X99DRAFT_403720 [Biscogniauxia marginata]|nr:hypothetical protein F5X99DRAFT_403720 [Biscogniauxia marginata]
MIALPFISIRGVFPLLLAITAVRSLDIQNDHPEPRDFDIDHYEDGIPTPFHEPLAYAAEDHTTKHALARRLDIPGTDIDLDTLADDVYDKVTSKVDGAIDDAKRGLNETIEAAKDGVGDAIDAAKGVLEDIKNAVEDIYQKVKDKVAELEEELGNAVKDWVWGHIGKPLLTIVVILLAPFVLLFLWWFLHLVAKPFARGRSRPAEFELQARGQDGQPYGAGEHVKRSTAGGGGGGGGGAQKVAGFVVRSWERYGQGIICLVCPWYGSFVLWRARNKTNKDLKGLKHELLTLSGMRQEMLVLEKRIYRLEGERRTR